MLERRAKHIMNLENRMKNKCNSVEKDIINMPQEKSPAIAKECELCCSAFIDETMLQKHIYTHTSELSLVCFECGADFANPLVFETHMVHHGIASADDVFSLNKSVKIKSVLKFKYTFMQLQILWNHYKHNNFPKKDEVKLLSRRLKIPMKHVQAWYKSQQNIMESSTKQNSGVKSTSVCCSLSPKQNGASSILKCTVCSAEFVSSNHMQCHTLIHKLGCSYSCDACSKTFCSETIRDTHTLSHYSGLGLKAKVQSLERELRTALKKLVNDCKDAALFSVANNGVVLNDEDSLSDMSEVFEENDQYNNGKCCIDDSCEHDNLNNSNNDEHLHAEASSPVKTRHYEKFNDMSSILQIDTIDEDVDVNTEDEDDELKLVIDE